MIECDEIRRHFSAPAKPLLLHTIYGRIPDAIVIAGSIVFLSRVTLRKGVHHSPVFFLQLTIFGPVQISRGRGARHVTSFPGYPCQNVLCPEVYKPGEFSDATNLPRVSHRT